VNLTVILGHCSLVAFPKSSIEVKRALGRKRNEVAQHEKGINIVILVLAGDLRSYYSRDVLWVGTLVLGVYNLEELVRVTVWVRGKEPKSR
jgi:hypothetical protein